jgi:hypothetical protein
MISPYGLAGGIGSAQVSEQSVRQWILLCLLLLFSETVMLSDTDTYENVRRAGERCARTPDMPNGHGIESCAGTLEALYWP